MRETLRTENRIVAIVRQRPVPGLIHHSDRGIQYAAEPYRLARARSGITPSMSRKEAAEHDPVVSAPRSFSDHIWLCLVAVRTACS